MIDDAITTWHQTSPWIDQPDADIDSVLKLLKKRRGWACKYNFDVAQYLRDWSDFGIVKFENVVSTDMIDQYLSDIDHLKREHMKFNVSVEVKGKQTYSRALRAQDFDDAGVKLNHMHTHSLAAAKLSLTKEVCQFLELVFREAPTVLQSLTFSKGSQQPIHVDYPYVNAQSCLPFMAASWTPLEDIHPESGPLAYYPGGHKMAITGMFDWGNGSIVKKTDSQHTSMQFADYLKEKMRLANIQPHTYCPKKGDVLIWHANLPHEGTAIVDKTLTRHSLVTHYTSKSYFPKRWMPIAGDRELKEVSINGGFAYRFPWSAESDRLPSWRV